jgi:predicted ester cyclase
MAAVDELCTGYAGDILKQSMDMLLLHAAIPDAQVTVEHTIAEADKVAVHSTLTGTHLGAFLGVPPTGKRVSVTKIDIFRVAGSKVVESWHQWDNVSLLVQLGAIGSQAPGSENGRGGAELSPPAG